MATRAGDIWELKEGREWETQNKETNTQGCPACCNWKLGWRWVTDQEGARRWTGPANQSVTEPTAQHVISGQCEGCGDPKETQHKIMNQLRAIQRGVQPPKRRNKRQKKGGGQVQVARTPQGDGGAYANTRNMIGIAMQSLKNKDWSERQAQALRRLISGDLPKPGDSTGGKAREKHVTRTMRSLISCPSTIDVLRVAWRLVQVAVPCSS